jgi:uncharacterized membrane protein YcjF (UPF0283 family)
MTSDENSDRSYSANSDEESCNDENGEVDRDEVKEVRKVSSKDTTRIRFWRLIVMAVLLLTAFAVTFTTYTLLQQQERKNFVTAVGNMLLYIICPLSMYLRSHSLKHLLNSKV